MDSLALGKHVWMLAVASLSWGQPLKRSTLVGCGHCNLEIKTLAIRWYIYRERTSVWLDAVIQAPLDLFAGNFDFLDVQKAIGMLA